MSSVRLRAMLAVTVGLLAAVPLVSAAAGGAPTGDELAACGPNVRLAQGWARISTPTYAPGEGENTIASFAAPAHQPGWVYVTNGRVIQMSTDAGCKWDHVYPVPTGRVPDPSSQVVGNLVAPTDHGIWATTYDDAGGVPRPHVIMSPDGEAVEGNQTRVPFQVFDRGLPAVGRPVALAVSADGAGRQGDEHAYVVVEEPVDPASAATAPTRHLFRLGLDETVATVAGPAEAYTWTEVAAPSGFGGLAGVAVSDVSGSTLWAWDGRAYARSTDAGATWARTSAPGEVGAIDVDDAGVASVYSAQPDGGGLVQHVRTPGVVLDAQATPVAARSASHGSRLDVAAIAGPGGTFGYDGRGRRWVDLAPPAAPALDQLRLGTGSDGRILLGRTPQALYRFDLFPGESFVRTAEATTYVPPVGTPQSRLVAPQLTPAAQVFTVRPGERRNAPVEFAVPPKPSRLDVFFLVDTTASMGIAIQGLKEGMNHIAAEIARKTRGQACFGVGDVKDFNPTSTYSPSQTSPYFLRQPITCDLSKVAAGIDQLRPPGGDDVPEEAQTIGLTQAVSGKGLLNPPVPEKQDAKFSAPTRVIVLITDAGFKMEPAYPGFPSMAETVQTLRSYHDTKVVGVVVHTRNVLGPAIRDMTAVVGGTRTLAPPSGADCDGNGRVDVLPNTPLLCETANEAPNIAPAIVGLLLAVKDPATMAVRAEDPDRVVLSPASRGVRSVVNLRVENRLTFRPTLTCAAAQDGKDLPVTLLGQVRGRVVATARIVVQCRARPAVLPPPPPPQLPDPPEPPPAPRPAPRPAAPPPFQPVTPNSPITNVNPNAGFSQQEEEQFQVATVTQDAAEDDEQAETELAMSRVAREDAAARLSVGAAMVLSAAAGGIALQRRRVQRALRTAHVRTR
jgi:hypothetical protein